MMNEPAKLVPQGSEIYPEYAALWHLESIGVMDALRDGARPPADGKTSRVAIIDTSVAVNHPCLVGAANRSLAIDFFSNRLGAFPYLDGPLEAPSIPSNLETDIADDLPNSLALLRELIDRLSPGAKAHVNGVAPTASADFSNHGTAIAGLVGARPSIMQIAPDYRSQDPDAIDVPLPYCGADPFCELVPISTNFDTDPESLILALLYAEVIDASVILIPRSFPDPFRTLGAIPMERDLLEAALPARPTQRETQLWEELAQLLVAVSLRRPIICAGGNFQEVGGIYPASLASEYNGIISVGAVNAKGLVAGYSTSQGLTVMAPSNDGETHDRVSVRLDEQDADFPDRRCPVQNENGSFSHFEIVSTDVPGRHGYSHGPYSSNEPPDGLREFGSYFCRFGGTSAASAIVAGFVSLGYSLGELTGTGEVGLAVKDWLLSRTIRVDTEANGSFHYLSWNGAVSFPDLKV